MKDVSKKGVRENVENVKEGNKNDVIGNENVENVNVGNGNVVNENVRKNKCEGGRLKSKCGDERLRIGGDVKGSKVPVQKKMNLKEIRKNAKKVNQKTALITIGAIGQGKVLFN